VTYSHSEDANKGILSMFYCRVLVGDSQKCAQHSGDYRDTEFKDPVNRIRYESMTDFLRGSNIFVVYKNRRAYPLYLIKYINKWISMKTLSLMIFLLDLYIFTYILKIDKALIELFLKNLILLKSVMKFHLYFY